MVYNLWTITELWSNKLWSINHESENMDHFLFEHLQPDFVENQPILLSLHYRYIKHAKIVLHLTISGPRTVKSNKDLITNLNFTRDEQISELLWNGRLTFWNVQVTHHF